MSENKTALAAPAATPNKDLLIVEEYDRLRALMAKPFERAGFTVYSASSPLDVLSLAKSLMPGIVIVDQGLSSTSSMLLLRLLRSHLPNSIVIMYATGSGVLQEREFERVGGEKTIPMRARVIAATNRDLVEEVAKGKFREDLYYRLNVVSIFVPPLRERKEDIPVIVEHLVRRINEKLHTDVKKISEPALEKILEHDWPGNVRELENVLTRAIVLSKSDLLEESAVPSPSQVKQSSEAYEWNRSLEEVERFHIAKVLEAVKNNRTEAARILGISKPTLYAKLPPTVKSDN